MSINWIFGHGPHGHDILQMVITSTQTEEVTDHLGCLFCCYMFSRITALLYSPSQAHRGDQPGSAHTVKAPAFPIPSGGRVWSTVLDGVGTSDRA